MNRQDRLILIKQAIMDSFMDVHDLVEMLELSVEDVVHMCPTRLLEYEHKFVIDMAEEVELESLQSRFPFDALDEEDEDGL